MATKSKKDLLMEAQDEMNHVVAQKRIDVLTALSELEEIRATDDYKVTIIEAIKAFNKPLPLAFISQVLPDSAQLLAARKLLREGIDGSPPLIQEFKDADDKTKIIIKLVEQDA